ncbi:MAG: hypothetical protein IPL65_10670 [Lewinellaceae bacterium]|nr:hypothetical protein [Lewinellaceae bacterium]
MKNKLLLIYFCFSTVLNAQSAWQLVHTPAPLEHYNDIHTVSANRVVLASEWGQVFHSSDGCVTIEKFQVPGDFSIYGAIDFSDEQNGFIGGGCWFPTDECVSGAMLRSTDGGHTWTRSQISDDLGVLQFVQAVNENTIFAQGDYAGLYSFNIATTTWDSLSHPGGLSGVFQGLQFVDENQGFLLKWNYVNGNNTFRLYKTVDGGQSFQVLQDSLPFNSSNVAGLYFFNANEGLIYNHGNMLYRTQNGGQSFEVQQVFPTGDVVQQLEFTDDLNGYAATSNNITQHHVLYRSTDGGLSWTPDLTIDSVYIQRFDMLDAENGYAYDSFNRIYRRSGTNAVAQANQPEAWQVLPNPAAGFLLVTKEGVLMGEEVFRLFDLRGELVLQYPLNQSKVQIPLPQLPNGPYFFRAGTRTGKVLIQQ